MQVSSLCPSPFLPYNACSLGSVLGFVYIYTAFGYDLGWSHIFACLRVSYKSIQSGTQCHELSYFVSSHQHVGGSWRFSMYVYVCV